MTRDQNAPNVTVFRGVLLGSNEQYVPDRPDAIWNLCDGNVVVPCLIPSDRLLRDLLSKPMATHRMQLVEWLPGGNLLAATAPVMTSALPDPHDEGLHQLPPDICPLDGVYRDTLSLVGELTTSPLRQFVERVHRDREVCARYWVMPASARHHHAFPGGLAAHSLEVARDLASQSTLADHERELAIAAGLLHDMGKVWSYTRDMFPNTAGRAMGHELVGLSRMERELQVLEDEWPDGAYALRVLLSGCGRMRQDGSMPSALVARLKAADQRSCEQERNQRDPSRNWKPRLWLPQPPPSNCSTGASAPTPPP